MRNILNHLFLPQQSNNHRARILHHETVIAISALLLAQSFFFAQFKIAFPQVLGAKVNMSVQELLQITNQKRIDTGLPALVLNRQLNEAAEQKAKYMFGHNFWAHSAPDGTTPWDFIRNVHYNYVFAGENLARGFSASQDVVDAWMASPDHRENMLSPSYQDVGFAIEQGDLTGEKNTVLVVEMFGSKTMPLSGQNPKAIKPITQGEKVAGLQQYAAMQSNPLINSRNFARNVVLAIVGVFLITLIIDLIITRRKVVRLFEHNLDHLMFMSFILLLIGFVMRGSIH